MYFDTPLLRGDYNGFLLIMFGTTNVSWVSQRDLAQAYSAQIIIELQLMMGTSIGLIKSVGYPIGLLLQILTVVFLVRGNSGYSRSARNWFLLVLGGDIGSTLYRVYDLITVDFYMGYTFGDYYFPFGSDFGMLMWGLRSDTQSARKLQDVMCRLFFIILYFPIYLSPIALTVSSLIRCYCVKFPLRAKASLTKSVDRVFMTITAALSLAISVGIAALVIYSWNSNANASVFGIDVLFGGCAIPAAGWAATNKFNLFIGQLFMLTVIFCICAANLLSSCIIIAVLFEAKKNRKSLSASDTSDSKAEVRATAMLLGMNVILFVCFFVSRLLAVMTTKTSVTYQPVAYIIEDRLSQYLFNIPYFTNSLFIAGFTRKFYEFFMPCLAKQPDQAASQKTIEENK